MHTHSQHRAQPAVVFTRFHCVIWKEEMPKVNYTYHFLNSVRALEWLTRSLSRLLLSPIPDHRCWGFRFIWCESRCCFWYASRYLLSKSVARDNSKRWGFDASQCRSSDCRCLSLVCWFCCMKAASLVCLFKLKILSRK